MHIIDEVLDFDIIDKLKIVINNQTFNLDLLLQKLGTAFKTNPKLDSFSYPITME